MKANNANDKQSIKSQRVKSYFIEAAKNIIATEGAENVSVRKVAEQAGYTFTTIYNYFKDLNELLQEVKNTMILDLMDYMKDIPPVETYDLEDVRKLNRLYIEYFINRPNIFTFFYSYRIRPADETTVALDFSGQYQETYKGFVASGSIREEDVNVIAKTIIYTIHGLLALYFSDNGMTADSVYEEMNSITGYLLKGESKK
jgi:AcrR family transcriptional regulator